MIRARKVRPDLPVVLATGGSMPDVPPEMTRHTAFLAKPFTLDELAATVNAMIEPGEAVS
jgi:DNA-binding NtrC family response regulator